MTSRSTFVTKMSGKARLERDPGNKSHRAALKANLSSSRAVNSALLIVREWRVRVRTENSTSQNIMLANGLSNVAPAPRPLCFRSHKHAKGHVPVNYPPNC